MPSEQARRTFRYKSTVKILPPSLSPERVKVDDFYAARSGLIPPLPWSTFSPPFSGKAGIRLRKWKKRPRKVSAIRRPMSPVRNVTHVSGLDRQQDGAGEGNRTLVVSLGSFCSTIELHPHFNDLPD